MKSFSIFVLICLISQQNILAQHQQPANDLLSLIRPWGQTIGTNTGTNGLQFLQLMQSTLTRFDELGQQITSQVNTRLGSLEDQLHDLAKQMRLTLINNNRNGSSKAMKT